MKKKLMALALFSATAAQANCWHECVFANPINGNCLKEIKVCDIADPGRAFASWDNDIQRVTSGIVATWHQVYGGLPAHFRHVLNNYPLTIACLISPETRAFALVAGMLEGIGHNTKRRIKDAEPIIQRAPDWKKNLIDEAVAYLFVTEAGTLATTDWNSREAQPYRDKYGVAYEEFLTCIDHAPNLNPEGEDCSWDFKTKVVALSRPVRGRTLDNAFIFQPFGDEEPAF